MYRLPKCEGGNDPRQSTAKRSNAPSTGIGSKGVSCVPRGDLRIAQRRTPMMNIAKHVPPIVTLVESGS